MNLAEMGLLALAGLAAGVVNAVAGGGTLISFPALVSVGLPMVLANTTNTVAIWPGTLSSVLAYRRELGVERRRALWLAVPSLVGGVGGAALLLVLPEETFGTIVPFLLLFACVLLAFGASLRQVLARWSGAGHPLVLGFVQLLVGVYAGYFGAAAGVLMMATMGVLLPIPPQHQNALKVWLAMLMNGVAAVGFVATGMVAWTPAAIMVITSLIGGFVGARLAQRLSPEWLRRCAIAVGLLAAGWLWAG